MDRLTPDEAKAYDEIEPHEAHRVFKFLIPADEIVSDMDTPFGRMVMKNLHNYRKEAGDDLLNAIHGKESITETQRIEYKQINMLIDKIEGLVNKREKAITTVRGKLAELFRLDKPYKT